MDKIILKINIILFSMSALLFVGCATQVKSEKTELTNDAMQLKKVERKEIKKDWIVVYSGDSDILKWKLKSINNQNAADLYNNLPVLRFDDSWKQIYGSAECNRYTGYYQIYNNTLEIQRVTATDRNCNNENETLFLNALKDVNEIKEQSNVLLLSKDGNEILVFDKY